MTTTIKDSVEQYLVHLGEKGQKPSTIRTAQRALALLAGHLGPDTLVSEVTTQDMITFKTSEAANFLPSGKRRMFNSITQIRTITRMFLTWVHEQGWISEIPLPPLAPVARRTWTKPVMVIAQRCP
jgi:hypothetical protein